MVSTPASGAFRNQLLQRLSDDDLASLTPHLEGIELTSRREIERANKPIEHVVFPECGIVSITNRGVRSKPLEIGIIGREGMTGLTVVLGNDRSPHMAFVQVPGEAHRIASDDLRTVMRSRATLRNLFLRYVQVFMTQTSYTAISNGTAKLEERLARWLLMAHDRVDGDEIPLVHDFLALMLGVRRPGVTVALHSLEGRGVISAKRSTIIVLDRAGLKELANSSYGVPESEYARLMDDHH